MIKTRGQKFHATVPLSSKLFPNRPRNNRLETPLKNLNLKFKIIKQLVVYCITIKGSSCGRRHNERYDSTGLFTVT
jgi:hypothetical protein